MKDIILVFVFILVIVLYRIIDNNLEREKDYREDYSNIKGEIITRPNGDIWFVFDYTKNQPRKYQKILDTYKQGVEVSSDDGFDYIISSLISKEYFEDTEKGKNGLFIVFKLIPKLESQQYYNNFYGPTQYVNGDNHGSISQDNRYAYIEKYRDKMVTADISLEDIRYLQENLEDQKIQRDFLSNYEMILKGIEVIGVGVNLFELFNKIFGG